MSDPIEEEQKDLVKVERIEQPIEKSMDPAELIKIAITEGSSVEKLEKLMDLQERWENRQALKQFNKSISAFRAECPAIDEKSKAYNSTYAGLSDTIESIKGLLEKYGLSYSWSRPDQTEEKISVTCKVTHLAGHSEETTLSGPPDDSGNKNALQAIGSTVKYLERYTLYAILGLTSKDMDDSGGVPDDTITGEQIEDLRCQLAEVNASENDFLGYLKVDSFSDITQSMFEKGVIAIKAKKEKAEREKNGTDK